MQTEPQVSGAAVNSLERRIDMSVATADVDKEVEQRLRQLSKTVKMAGFRPGKVPFKIVAQQYGGQARSEAIGAAVERVFGEKVREQNLRVAGYPRIEPKAASGGAALEFSAVFEVYPEVVIGDVAGQAIEKPMFEVTDAEVDNTIDVLRKQRTTYVTAGRAAEKGDRMVIDFVGRKNGEEFVGGKATDFAVGLGDGRMLPDFEAALVGLTEGAAKTFDVAFPADYQAAELAGQTVQFDVVAKKVDMPRLPEIDAEFAKSLGIKDGDLVKMRTEVRANLEREVKKRLLAKVKNLVMDALLVVTPIEVPSALVEAESRQMAEAALKDFQQRGMDVKSMPVEPSWFAEPATRRVKLGLILAELVKSKDLHAKPAQVRGVVDDLAETFEDPQEVVRWYYSQPQRLAEAEALVMENNVVDWVLAQAKVTEKAVAFDDLMGNAA
ncbi:MAG: trigger factor [Rhodocyclales bacterium GWA2_65_20]|nr:MAG: trigger factor [Rhodocyclales bacterium GWA2_65_20]